MPLKFNEGYVYYETPHYPDFLYSEYKSRIEKAKKLMNQNGVEHNALGKAHNDQIPKGLCSGCGLKCPYLPGWRLFIMFVGIFIGRSIVAGQIRVCPFNGLPHFFRAVTLEKGIHGEDHTENDGGEDKVGIPPACRIYDETDQ